ncbi:MAG: MmcQ/YjbR family DNA-binding protein [Oceanospirillaceae bacterium]|nr:MmcQ/YjbR family DNA-binding protein [Oceanospirillaceae bacterium]
MNYNSAKTYLLSHPEAIEDFPFGPEVAVFKIKGKMFATLGLRAEPGKDSQTTNINLKCDPAEAQMLRDIFSAVIPGYHMNKRHWNTVILDDSIPDGEIERMIDRSYALVIKGMTKKLRASLEISYSAQELYNNCAPEH